MSNSHLLDPRAEIAGLIRNEPVQARSTARLAALLDAAAEVIDEIGYERLTTAMVAERAGASIGTVYRYFPDRIAVLQSLAARNAERIMGRVDEALRDPSHETAVDALRACQQIIIDAYRDEPGYASLRLGDVLDLRPATASPMNAVLADHLHRALVERFGIPDTEDARIAFQATIEANDALVARAFARDRKGFRPFIDMGGIATRELLVDYVPDMPLRPTIKL